MPVTGECELATGEVLPPATKLPAYVQGLLSLEDEIVEIVDLERLIAMHAEKPAPGSVSAEVRL